MKLIVLPAALIIAFAGPFAPAGHVRAAEPVTFAIKFPPGQIDRESTSVEMDQTISGDALPAPRTQSSKKLSSDTLTLIESNAMGSTVKMTYGKSTASGVGVDVSGDNDKAAAAVGESITLHFSPTGRIEKVEGLDAIEAKIRAQSGQGAGPPQLLLSADGIKELYNSPLDQFLPRTPVRIGDTWESEISRKYPAPAAKIKNKVKLVDVEERNGHRIAKLEFTGAVSMEDDLAFGGGVGKIKFDRCEQDGTAEFDLTRGWWTVLAVEERNNGKMLINPPGGRSLSFTFTQTLKARIVTKPESAK